MMMMWWFDDVVGVDVCVVGVVVAYGDGLWDRWGGYRLYHNTAVVVW